MSGKKNELVERVARALRLRLQNVNTVVHDDRVEFEHREKERLLTPVGEELTHPSCIDKWISDVTMIPDLSEKDIYNYFVYKLNTKRQNIFR